MSVKTNLFAIQYVKSGGDVVAAAEAMSITPATGKRYLRKPEVQEYIEELNKDIEKVVGINKAKVVQMQLNIHKSAMKGDPIFNKEGKKVGRRKDRSTARACLAEVSKMMGYDAPKKVDVNVDLSSWLTQQPKELIDTEVVDAKTD